MPSLGAPFGHSAGQLLSSPWFQIAGIPLGLMLVGVLAKRLGRRDGDRTPRRNDAAVSTEILLIILGAALVDFRNTRNPIAVSTNLGWLAAILVLVFLSIDHDRFHSWVRDARGAPTATKHLFFGVILPDLVALGVFALYQAQKI